MSDRAHFVKNKPSLVKGVYPRFPSIVSSKIWDDIFGDFFDGWNNLDSAMDKLVEADSTPYDIVQTKDETGNVSGVECHFALAGFNPEDVTVDVNDYEVFIKVNKSETKKDESINYIHRGLAKRNMQFSYVLSNQIDREKITASFENGMLKINMPYIKNKEPKRIKLDIKNQIPEKTESDQ